jgi:hypothetical protein
MPELENPQHEKACQLRASGRSFREAYREGFGVTEDHNNSTRFFRQPHIRERIAELVQRRAVMADLDDVFVLRQLKSLAKNGEALGNANLDDYFAKNAAGERIGIDLANVPREKLELLEEVVVDQVVEGRGEERKTIRRTKIKLRSASGALQACEMLGKYLGLWKEGKGPGDIPGTGKVIYEVHWQGSPQEVPATNGDGRALAEQP